MSRDHRPPTPADKPDPDFVDALAECTELALELRTKVAHLMHVAPQNGPAWIATFTDPGVCRGLGNLLMLTGKPAAWVNTAVNQAVGVLNSAVPAMAPALTEHFVEGQVDAELSCGCGDCVPCGQRNEHGIEKAREIITAQLSPATKKKHGRLVDPRGNPLH